LRGRLSQASLSLAKPNIKASRSDTDGQNTGYQFIISQLKKTFANIVHRTGTNAVTCDIPQSEHVTSLARPDVFWDAFEQHSLDFQVESSLLSFADIASNSDSGYWTDSDLVCPIPWSSCSNYPAFSKSSLEGNLPPPEVESTDNTETSSRQQAYPHVFKATDSSPRDICITCAQGLSPPSQGSDETQHHTCTAILIESPAQVLLESSAGPSAEELMCSDDPFMGSWTSEKEHHLFDDYGWVLHHVENL
jgi:hypothetical protein